MTKPFHLSFAVPNLEDVRKFYINILGCKVGRDTGKWIDVMFFGHQITIHQESEEMHSNPIDHFGAVLSKCDWVAMSNTLSSRGIAFKSNPTIREAGTDFESGKFTIKDPASNVLEFKYYESFNATMTDNNE